MVQVADGKQTDTEELQVVARTLQPNQGLMVRPRSGWMVREGRHIGAGSRRGFQAAHAKALRQKISSLSLIAS
jgi:hypothetical protein